MSSAEQEDKQPNPSQVNGQMKSLQGQAYSAISSALPTGQNAESWKATGDKLQKEGEDEINNAKAKAALDSTIDGAQAKLKSAAGYVTGDQDKQAEGNVENEQAQWKFKQATSDNVIDGIPVPSAEGLKGKLESVQGMLTGDQSTQLEGNLRAEKAAWKDGV